MLVHNFTLDYSLACHWLGLHHTFHTILLKDILLRVLVATSRPTLRGTTLWLFSTRMLIPSDSKKRRSWEINYLMVVTSIKWGLVGCVLMLKSEHWRLLFKYPNILEFQVKDHSSGTGSPNRTIGCCFVLSITLVKLYLEYHPWPWKGAI